MAEYERSRLVQAPADEVFAFVSDPSNPAAFVPTVGAVEPQTDDHVRVRGKDHGRSYEDEGWFHVDQARRRLEWDSDARAYSGWLSVASADGGTRVVAYLSVPPHVSPTGRPLTEEPTSASDSVESSLEATLDALRNLMESRGGKEETAHAR